MRENSNDEFQKLDRYAAHGTGSFDVFLLVMTSDGNRQVVLGCFGLNLETVLSPHIESFRNYGSPPCENERFLM